MMIYCFSCLKNYNQETKETFSLTKRQIPICRDDDKERGLTEEKMSALKNCVAEGKEKALKIAFQSQNGRSDRVTPLRYVIPALSV